MPVSLCGLGQSAMAEPYGCCAEARGARSPDRRRKKSARRSMEVKVRGWDGETIAAAASGLQCSVVSAALPIWVMRWSKSESNSGTYLYICSISSYDQFVDWTLQYFIYLLTWKC